MSRHHRGLTTVGSLVPRALRRAGRPPADATLAAARDAWPGVVGSAAAAHSSPVRRSRGGVLTIGCSDAAWSHELNARSELLAARLAEALGRQPLRLRFAVVEQIRPAEGASRASRRRQPTAAQRTRADELVGDVADPELRRLLTAAAALAVAREDATKIPAKRAQKRRT